MKDFQTRWEESSNECIQCNQEFTKQNPCYNDDSIFEMNGIKRHLNGICRDCSTAEAHWRPTSQHERGE